MDPASSSGDQHSLTDRNRPVRSVGNAITKSLLEQLGARRLEQDDGGAAQNGSDKGKVEYYVIQPGHDLNYKPTETTGDNQTQTMDLMQKNVSSASSGNNMVIKMLKIGAGTQDHESASEVVIEYGKRQDKNNKSITTDSDCRNEENDSGLVVIEYSEEHKDNHHGLVPVDSVITEDAENICRIVTDSACPDQRSWKTLQEQNVPSVEDRLICGQCSYMCHQVKDFLFHKSTHANQRRSVDCELCGLKYSRQKTLANHYKQKHRLSVACIGIAEVKRSGKLENRALQAETGVSDSISINNSGICVKAKQTNGEVLHLSDKDKGENICTVDKAVTFHTAVSRESNSSETGMVVIHDDDKEKGCVEVKVLCESSSDVETRHTTVSDTNIRDNKHESIVCNIQMSEPVDYTSTVTSVDTNSKTFSSVIVEPVVSDVTRSNLHLKALTENKNETRSNTISTTRPSVLKPDDHDFHFISNIGLVKGQSLSYGKHEFKCLHCQFKTQWRNTLCIHMKDKHSKLIENDKHLLVNYPANRDGQKILRMSEYINMQKKKVKHKRVRGIETQDLPGDFPCSLCGKVYHRLRYLRCHMERHTATSNLLCSECGKAFKTKAYLAQHMRSHRVKETYQCSQCEFQSTVNTLIHAHIQIHNDGCLVCDICGAAFTDKSTLQRHKRVHDNSRPFACKFDGCTLRFKKEVTRNGHYKQHFTSGKFECNICGYVFRHKHHLLRHEKGVHNLKPVKRSTDQNVNDSHLGPIAKENLDLPLARDVNAENNTMETSGANLITNEGGTVTVNSENADDQFDLESALQSGQLVIATDEDGNPVNYEMSDIGMNVAYQTLLHGAEGHDLETHTILIPQADANNIVFEEVTETVGTYVET